MKKTRTPGPKALEKKLCERSWDAGSWAPRNGSEFGTGGRDEGCMEAFRPLDDIFQEYLKLSRGW